jgi:hypothetical protein
VSVLPVAALYTPESIWRYMEIDRPFDYRTCFSHRYTVQEIQDVPKLAKRVIDPLKHFLHLQMLNSVPKWHKLMPLTLKFRLSSTMLRDTMSPNYAEKRKKTRYNNVHAIERPDSAPSLYNRTAN